MERPILVLGGGGVKGLAHIGAWRALEDAGVEFAEVVGTSIGALVAAAIGAGVDYAGLVERGRELEKKDIVGFNRWALLVNGIRQPSIFRDDPLRDYIAEVLPVDRFEELALPVSMNAVDLESGEEAWFGAGGRTDVSLVDAVYASSALPLFYPPAEIGGRHYVDGGVADSLPIRRAAARGADLVVAVDVSAGPVKDAMDTVSRGMIAIHHRVFDIMAYADRLAVQAAWSGPPVVRVRPMLDGYSTFDFENTRYFLDEGYRAAREAWEAWERRQAAEVVVERPADTLTGVRKVLSKLVSGVR